ncbi:peptidoglycan recognition protein-like [Tubulanus polymorphus]|uniref:peptidoglycan recognition protein-like n=1 Tax=Tubulanus polymorphus TaxID=672921 RepID=UPI003DA56FC0
MLFIYAVSCFVSVFIVAVNGDSLCWNRSGKCQTHSTPCAGPSASNLCSDYGETCCLPRYCNSLNVIGRQEWNARPPKSVSYLNGPMPMVFIHHTAMDFCYNKTSCSKEMRIIQNLHMDGRSWDDIGYSFLVGEDGRVYVGRGWDRVGAHTKGYNTRSLGISVMGNFMKRRPNNAALDTVKLIIRCGIYLQKIKPDYDLFGHRQVRQTQCPGDYFYNLIKGWPHYKTTPPA